MSKKSPAPPPAPDYAGAAQQQGIANLEAARLTARLSNPNIRTPLGGQNVSWGRPQFNRAAYDAAMADWNKRNPQPQPGVQNGLSFSGGQPAKPNQQPPSGTSISNYGKPNAAPPTTDIGGGAQMPTGGMDALKATPAVMPSGGDREFVGARRDLLPTDIGMGGGMGPGAATRAAQMGGDLFRDTGMMGGSRIDASGMGPGQATRAAQGYDPSFAQYGYAGDVMPTREMFTTMTDLDTPFIEQYLTPEAQATLEAQQRVDRALAGLGESAIGRVQNIYGQNFTPTGLPAQQFSFERGALPTLPNLQGQAEANVGAMPVNYGPTGGQFGTATGGPSAGQFGMAAGGPGGVNLQGLDTSGITGVQTGVAPAGQATGGPAAPTLQGQLDTRNLAAMPVNAGMTAQQAILSRLDPSLERQRSQLETQLANQGLARGGEAYDVAMQEQSQRENDLRTQAALQGLQLDMAARQQGLGEAQALGGFANQAALQGFGAGQQATQAQNAAIAQNAAQALQSGQFANQAQAQQFAQRLAAGEFGREAQLASFQTGQAAQDAVNRAIAQNFQQGQAAGQMGNQAIAQNFNQALQAQGAYNAAAQQGFGQAMDVQSARNAALTANQQMALQQAQAQAALQAQGFNQAQAAAAFANAQRQAALQEQLALRNQPLNEITALMGASQVQMPQFQPYVGADVAAAPIFGASQAAGNFAQQNYSNQVAANNAKLGMYGSLLGGLGTAAGGGFFGNPFGKPGG